MTDNPTAPRPYDKVNADVDAEVERHGGDLKATLAYYSAKVDETEHIPCGHCFFLICSGEVRKRYLRSLELQSLSPLRPHRERPARRKGKP